MKAATLVLLAVAIVCFLFPFVRASFLGSSVEVSGLELTIRMSFHDKIDFSEDDGVDPFLIVGFACGLLGLAIAWEAKPGNKNLAVTGGISFACALCLWFSHMALVSEFDQDGFGILGSISFGWGWIFSEIMYVGAAITAIIASSLPNASVNVHVEEKAGDPVSPDGRIVHNNKALSGGDVQKTVILQPESAARLRVIVKRRQGLRVTQEWTPTEFPCFIGRDASVAKIVVPDARISKIHARLYIEQGAVMVSDENSSNGTFVNGEKISFPVELLTGDEVRIGETTLFFEVSE